MEIDTNLYRNYLKSVHFLQKNIPNLFIFRGGNRLKFVHFIGVEIKVKSVHFLGLKSNQNPTFSGNLKKWTPIHILGTETLSNFYTS